MWTQSCRSTLSGLAYPIQATTISCLGSIYFVTLICYHDILHALVNGEVLILICAVSGTWDIGCTLNVRIVLLIAIFSTVTSADRSRVNYVPCLISLGGSYFRLGVILVNLLEHLLLLYLRLAWLGGRVLLTEWSLHLWLIWMRPFNLCLHQHLIHVSEMLILIVFHDHGNIALSRCLHVSSCRLQLHLTSLVQWLLDLKLLSPLGFDRTELRILRN